MQTLAQYVKSYPEECNSFKQLDDINKYCNFIESKPTYDPDHSFWKDFEEYDRSNGDGWIRLRYKSGKSVWWFPKLQEVQTHNGEVLKTYEEIVRYILL
jgi:hypothetical protein